MRGLIALVRPEGSERGRLALSVALAAGATGAAIALLATSGYLISRAAQRPMIIALMVTIVAVRALGITRAVLRYGERLSSHDLALRQLARLRALLYRRLAPLVPGQLDGLRRGDLLARFVSDVDTLQDAYLRVLIPVLVCGVVVLGAAMAGALMAPAVGLVVLCALGAAAVAGALSSAWVARRSSRLEGPARADLSAQLVEAIDGAAELAVLGRSQDFVARLARADARLASAGRRDALASASASALQSLITGAGLIAVLLVGIAAVRAGSLPGVLLAAVTFLFLGAGEVVTPVPAAARRLQSCEQAAAELAAVIERPVAISDPAIPRSVPGGGPLALEGVSFAYGAGPVLREVDLRIETGEKIALTGPGGTGKTTLAEILVRFLDPVAGRVTLGGADLRELTQERVRSEVLLCAQDAHLFNTSARENLLIANRAASEAQLWDALSTVEMDAFVAALPEGLDTLVGQLGERLSGGQRQRLALARALVSPARFLILDEPTAHLDGPLAERITERLLERGGGRALLVITHGGARLKAFDRVLRLEGGVLRENVRRQ